MAHQGSKRYLLEYAYATSTLTKYKEAVNKFLKWVYDNSEDAKTVPELDILLTDYLHFLYESGGGKGQASCTIFGVLMYYPSAKDHLPTARLALRGWNKRHPSLSYPPLTWELAVAIAVQMVRSNQYAAGLATLLGFDCYLRIGEICGLRCEDVATSKDVRLGSRYTGVALRLRQTKTGPNQWVEVDREGVKVLLLRHLSSVEPKKLVFQLSPPRYRKIFKQVCAELQLSSSYVPHSLRHGGATEDHIAGKPLEDILMRGRWASTKSARRYVQAGRAMLLATQVPKSTADIGAVLARDILSSFSLAQMH